MHSYAKWALSFDLLLPAQLHLIVKETFCWSQFCWWYLLVGGYCEDSMGTVGWLQGDGLLIHSAQNAWAAVLFDLPCLCIKRLPCRWKKKKQKKPTPLIFNLLWANTIGFIFSKLNLTSVFLLSVGFGIIRFQLFTPAKGCVTSYSPGCGLQREKSTRNKAKREKSFLKYGAVSSLLTPRMALRVLVPHRHPLNHAPR